MAISVLLADAHQLFRDGLRNILNACDDIEVTGEASDGDEALRLLATRRFDVAVVDASLPGRSGLDVVAKVAAAPEPVPCILISGGTNGLHLELAMRAGASGFVSKCGTSKELIEAIRTVRAGRRYVPSSAAPHLMASFRRSVDPSAKPAFSLTARQREILRLIAEGHSSKEIAAALDLSKRTVECHRANLMEKLGIRKTAKLVRFAVREGLVAE